MLGKTLFVTDHTLQPPSKIYFVYTKQTLDILSSTRTIVAISEIVR